MTAAYVTHGRKYHLDPACPRMLNGEGLHDWEGDDYGGGFFAGSYRREDPDPQYAAARGKLPCLGCVPTSERVYPPLYGQTFGHEPWFTCLPDFTKGYACARCRVRARCVTVGSPEDDPHFHMETHAIPWPCTSAVVLGLAPREAAR
ncbi:hypothetical protein ACKI14_02420 [Streptomyces turgidiscabies]|uniref:hypothetical protein n=1 Tax=Streptomyces turgidiscabies TaxID=85558 RepID=UPI0038F65F16